MAMAAMMADLLIEQVVEHPLQTPSAFAVSNDDDGWVSLADVHALTETEVQQLMGCEAMVVDASWQVVVIDAQMKRADVEHRTDRLARLLCLLIRAEVAEGVDTSPLEETTLRVALRCEEVVSPDMASCVRLARVLACKLDATNAIADICDNASRVE
jgi:hypothetical protein